MNILKYIKHNYRTITLASYLLPILFSVVVSLAHVVAFWEITNPFSWAIFLSIAIEVAVLTSIAASRLSNKAWIPFIIVTFVQIIGNIFYSFTEINVDGRLFKSWVEMVDPIYQWFGSAGNDIMLHKRVIAMSGAFIPLIAIVGFNFFIHAVRMNPKDLEIGLEIPEEKQPEIITNTPINPNHFSANPADWDKEPELAANAVKIEPVGVSIPLSEPEIAVMAVKNEEEPINQGAVGISESEGFKGIPSPEQQQDATIKKWEDMGMLKDLPEVLEFPEIGTASYTVLPEPIITSVDPYGKMIDYDALEKFMKNVEPAISVNEETTEPTYVESQEPVVVADVENKGALDSIEKAAEQEVEPTIVAEETTNVIEPTDEKKNLMNL